MKIYKKLTVKQKIVGYSTAILIILFYFFFNFNYLSNWVDEKGDVLTYSYYVKLGIPQYIFNPHHIGFDWLGQQMTFALTRQGYDGSTMLVLQMRNLIISSIGLGLFFFFFFKISKKYFLSLLLISLIAFSCAFWIYSQINDTPIIHSILIGLLFFAALYFPQAKRKLLYTIFLGVIHALCIFFHQSDLIFLPVLLFVITFATRIGDDSNGSEIDFIERNGLSNSTKKTLLARYNLKYSLVYLEVFSMIVVVAYYYVGIIKLGLTLDPKSANYFNNIKGSSYFFNWLILYAKIDYWGKGFEDAGLFEKVTHGISTYFYQPQVFKGLPLKANFSDFFSPSSVLPNMIGSYFIFIFISTIVFIRGLYKKYNFTIIAVGLFLVIYFSFSFWWEPSYREFWVTSMLSFWFLSFFVLNFLLDKQFVLKRVFSLTLYSFLLVFTLLLFYFNFTGFIYPNSSTNYKKFDIVRSESHIRVKDSR